MIKKRIIWELANDEYQHPTRLWFKQSLCYSDILTFQLKIIKQILPEMSFQFRLIKINTSLLQEKYIYIEIDTLFLIYEWFWICLCNFKLF